MLIKIGNHHFPNWVKKNTPNSTERSSAPAEGVEKSSASSQSPSVPPSGWGYEVDDGGGC